MTDGPSVGVGIIVRRAGEVLLVRRDGVHGAGTWSTPGGHLDPGESLEACAAREAREETGVEVEEISFLAITNDVFEEEDRHYLTVWMEAELAEGEAEPRDTDELSEVGWFAPGELPRPLFLPLANLLEGRCHPPGAGER